MHEEVDTILDGTISDTDGVGWGKLRPKIQFISFETEI